MILFFGPQGSGKGTQAELLAKANNWRWLSTGQMLRDSNDPEISRRLVAGELIDDALTAKMLIAELSRIDKNTEVILDGYPRNLGQAQWLLDNLPKYSRVVTCSIEIQIPKEESVVRLLARGRNDDTRQAIERRLEIYHNETEPIIDFYRARGIACMKVSGMGSIDEIHQRIQEVVEQCIHK